MLPRDWQFGAQPKTFPKDTVVLECDVTNANLFKIQEGSVIVEKRNGENWEIVEKIGKGGVFGQTTSILGQLKTTVRVTSEVDCEILVIHAETLMQTCEKK